MVEILVKNMQNKRYEILDRLPPYGSMYKSIPNCGKNVYS